MPFGAGIVFEANTIDLGGTKPQVLRALVPSLPERWFAQRQNEPKDRSDARLYELRRDGIAVAHCWCTGQRPRPRTSFFLVIADPPEIREILDHERLGAWTLPGLRASSTASARAAHQAWYAKGRRAGVLILDVTCRPYDHPATLEATSSVP